MTGSYSTSRVINTANTLGRPVMLGAGDTIAPETRPSDKAKKKVVKCAIFISTEILWKILYGSYRRLTP